MQSEGEEEIDNASEWDPRSDEEQMRAPRSKRLRSHRRSVTNDRTEVRAQRPSSRSNLKTGKKAYNTRCSAKVSRSDTASKRRGQNAIYISSTSY